MGRVQVLLKLDDIYMACMLIVGLIICIPPGILTETSSIGEAAQKVLQGCVCVGIFGYYFFNKIRLNSYLCALWSLCFWLIFVTCVNLVNPITALFRVSSILSVCCLIDIFIRIDAKKTITYILYLFLMYITVNTLCIVLYPNSMYLSLNGLPVCWFLGSDNTAVGHYLFGIYVAFIYDYMKYEKFYYNSFYMLSNAVFLVFYNDIATGAVVVIVLLFLLVVKKVRWLRGIVTLRFCILSQVLLFLLLMFIQKWSVLSFFIVDLLGKSITFSGRTYIWQMVIDRISDSIVMGNGVLKAYAMNDVIGMYGIVSAHNFYLQLIFWGGLIAGCIFLWLFFVIDKKIKSYPKDWLYIGSIVGLYPILLRHQLETSPYQVLFMALTLLYYQDYFRNCLRKNKEYGNSFKE